MIILALISIALFAFSQRRKGAVAEILDPLKNETELPYIPEVAVKYQWKIYNPNAKAIDSAASEYGVPSWLIVGLINVESGGDTKARGSKGEVGLMQLYSGGAILDWRNRFGFIYSDEFFEKPENNIRVGTWHLSQLHKSTKANWLNTAIHAYQVGATGFKNGRRSPDRSARLKRFTEAVLIYDANDYTV